jgi:hypothetical protein
MNCGYESLTPSRKSVVAGSILTGILVALLLLDGVVKIMMITPVMESCAPLEIPPETVPLLGIILMAAALIYAIPQTSVFGAILLTGYLGGAVWTHLRINDPAFSIIFPFILGTLIWGAIYLRSAALRALMPWHCIRSRRLTQETPQPQIQAG